MSTPGAAVVAVPLRAERAALAGRLPGTRVLRTGMGPARSAARTRARLDGAGAVLVVGVAGALHGRLRPGDLVVADELWSHGPAVPSPSAPLLAAALRRRGLPVHVGPLLTRASVRGPGAAALAVDMESAAIAAAAGVPAAAVRAIVDTPSRPLLRPGTPARGVRALAALRRAAPAMQEWVAATGPREVLLAGPRSFCAVDLVLVVGSANSSDSRRLVEVAEREGTPAHLVEDAAAVDLRWLAGVARVGITAGASAPASLVDDLVAALRGLGPLTVRSAGGAAEDVRFALPKESI